MADRTISVIIADDHPVLRKGLRGIVTADAAFSVVAEAGDGEQALRLIEEFAPQIAILDVDMPSMNGFEVATKIAQRGLRVATVILSMYETESMVNRALDLGVMGYIVKASAETDIVRCLHDVAAGRHFVSPSLVNFLVRRRNASSAPAEKSGLSSLTRAERVVLALIAEKKTTNDIASQLSVSPRTIETHRRNICDKLGITGTNALLAYALENKDALR